ncbi:MAG: hypothetical protein AB8B58_20175 [Roseobacter sp.]
MNRFLSKTRTWLIFGLVGAALASCGAAPVRTPPALMSAVASPQGALPFAQGPIYRACLDNRRSKASRSRCGCIQAAADVSLSASDQQRGTRYFSNPAALQEVRQSGNPGNERFWGNWTRFADTASQLCSRS